MTDDPLRSFTIPRKQLNNLLEELRSDAFVGKTMGDLIRPSEWLTSAGCISHLRNDGGREIKIEKSGNAYIIRLNHGIWVEEWSDLYKGLLECHAACLEALPRSASTDKMRERLRRKEKSLADRRDLDALLAATEDASPSVRRALAGPLSSAKDPRALPALTRLLNDSNRSVQIEAALHLGHLGDPAATPLLVNAFEEIPDLDFREVILAAISAPDARIEDLRERIDVFDPIELIIDWADQRRDPLSRLVSSNINADFRLWPRKAVQANFQRLGATASDRLADLIDSPIETSANRIGVALFASTLRGVLLTPRLTEVLRKIASAPGSPPQSSSKPPLADVVQFSPNMEEVLRNLAVAAQPDSDARNQALMIRWALEALISRSGGFMIRRDHLETLLRGSSPETVIGSGPAVHPWVTAAEAIDSLKSCQDAELTVEECDSRFYVIHLAIEFRTPGASAEARQVDSVAVHGWSDLYRGLFECHSTWLEALPRSGATEKALELLRRRTDLLTKWRETFAKPLQSSNESARVSFARDLASCDDKALLRRSLDALLAATGDLRSPFVREALAGPLSKTGDPKVLPALTRLLRDNNRAVQTTAALHLGRLGDRSAIEPLIEVFEKTPNLPLREAIADALGALGYPAENVRKRIDVFDPVDLIVHWADDFHDTKWGEPLKYLESSPEAPDIKLWPRNAVAANFQRLGAPASDRLADLLQSQIESPSEAICVGVWACRFPGVLLTRKLEASVRQLASARRPTRGQSARQLRIQRLAGEWAQEALKVRR